MSHSPKICSHLALLSATSALIRFVRFFLRHFAEFSARSLEWLCSNIVLGSHSNTAHRSTQHAKRRFLSHLRSFRTENHQHRQSPPGQASKRDRELSVKIQFWPAKAQKPEGSALCTVALNTLHLNFKLTCAFQKSPSMSHAFQAYAGDQRLRTLETRCDRVHESGEREQHNGDLLGSQD